MKELYSIQLEALDYSNDVFTSELYSECIEYTNDRDYTELEYRLAKILVDTDGNVLQELSYM